MRLCLETTYELGDDDTILVTPSNGRILIHAIDRVGFRPDLAGAGREDRGGFAVQMAAGAAVALAHTILDVCGKMEDTSDEH